MQGEKNSRKGKQRNTFRKNIIGFLKIKTIKMRKEKKMEEERKKGKKKRKTPQNCKSPTYRQRFITPLKNVTEYTHIHTHKQNQNSPTKIKHNRLTWQTKETKNYIYQNKTN